MSKNFVAYADAQALMEEIGKQKLTVTDVMPAASPDLLEKTRLYIGADTASLEKGGVYQCQAVEVTPAGTEDPQSEGWYVYNSVSEEYELTTDTSVVSGTTYYEIKWVNILKADVDLSKYKTIWGGTKEGWEALTQAEQDEYDYCAFEDDATEYFAVVDAVTEEDMHPVTSNAVAKKILNYIDWDSNSIIGAHNLYNLSCPSRTNSGITFTVNSDGTITISGTATADAYLFNLSSTTFAQYSTPLKKGTYTVSGSIDNNNIYFAVVANISGSIERVVTCNTSEEKTFTLSEDTDVSIQAYVTNGQSITTPVTLKPMIRLKSDNNSDFQPCAMTNHELTPVKLWENPELYSSGNLTYFSAQKVSIPTLSKYKFIKIFFCIYDRSNQKSDSFINNQGIGGVLSTVRNSPSANYYIIGYSRSFTINSDGITFADCIEGHLNNASNTNAYQIPLQIWGSNTPI